MRPKFLFKVIESPSIKNFEAKVTEEINRQYQSGYEVENINYSLFDPENRATLREAYIVFRRFAGE